MTKAYKVAGEIFQIEMEEGNALWNSLCQYAPFETEPCPDPLFTLALSRIPPEMEPEPLYVGHRNDREPWVDLYSTPDGGWYFETAPDPESESVAAVLSEPGFKKAELEIRNGNCALFGLNNSLMMLFAFATADKGILELHSSVVEYKGRAYAFLGVSGAGKSTHSRQWLKAFPESRLLNDDNPVLRLTEDGGIKICGSPWSGKTPCYINREVDAGAFVDIRKSPFNKAVRMDLLHSYATIYSCCSGFKGDSRMADGLHRTMEKVATEIPFFYMECLPDEDAARVCAASVVQQ